MRKPKLYCGPLTPARTTSNSRRSLFCSEYWLVSVPASPSSMAARSSARSWIATW
ncbi:MAG: hypothetical protein U0168_03505 [Nannocystaceae bacterium]